MTMQVEFWQLVTLLLSFLGFVFTAGRILLSQIDRRLNERFAAMENSRELAGRHWDEKFSAVLESNRSVEALERDFLRWKAELPLQYVRREDYIRGQSVLEAKMDALYNKLEVVQMKGVNNG